MTADLYILLVEDNPDDQLLTRRALSLNRSAASRAVGRLVEMKPARRV